MKVGRCIPKLRKQLYSFGVSDCLNDTDRFLLELRNGCWMSYISQAFDVMDNVSMFQPCNCRLFINYLIRYPEEKRIHKLHQKEIIEYNCPEFKDVKYTDDYPEVKRSFCNKFFSKIKRKLLLLKMYGVKSILVR